MPWRGWIQTFTPRPAAPVMILAGKNFGCGSSREHAPIALSHSGIKAVLALSFARIFYRNAVDGAFLLPIEIGQDAYDGISEGDTVEVDTEANLVRNVTRNQTYHYETIFKDYRPDNCRRRALQIQTR